MELKSRRHVADRKIQLYEQEQLTFHFNHRRSYFFMLMFFYFKLVLYMNTNLGNSIYSKCNLNQ